MGFFNYSSVRLPYLGPPRLYPGISVEGKGGAGSAPIHTRLMVCRDGIGNHPQHSMLFPVMDLPSFFLEECLCRVDARLTKTIPMDVETATP